MVQPIDIGFRWLDNISIKLEGERIGPDAKLQLKVSGDIEKCEIIKGSEKIPRWASNEIIPCNETKEVVVELYEYKRKYGVLKEKMQVLYVKVPLEDDELYTETTYRSSTATITLYFAYTPGGELRNQVGKARRITNEQKAVLDKIRRVHRFFQGLETVCQAIEDVHPYIKAASIAILSLYKLCENQKKCRDAARSLVDEMDDLLRYGVEELDGVLRVNSTTKAAFKSLVNVMEEVSGFIEEQNKGVIGSLLRDAVSTNYESRLEELRDKLKRGKGGLQDSINFGTWVRVVNADLRCKLESVPRAHYSSGEGCLEGTRRSLLADVDTWVRGCGSEKMAWVHGHAGSGKSALLNSIAEHLENAGIPFTCFPCRRDDPDLSDIHKILATIAYIFTEYYGDYRGFISNLVNQPMGRSILTGDIQKQSELLFGKAHELISPKGANRPAFHIILIDALDECRNHHDSCKTADERCTLLRSLIGFAGSIPWIKVLITSRPEPDIVEVFNDVTFKSAVRRIDINADEWNTSNDIRLFIETKLDEYKLALSPNQINCLNDKASGLFIWCATVFRYIARSKRSRKDIIKHILGSSSPWSEADESPFDSLYALYQRVLDSAVVSQDDKLKMESILGVLFAASSRKPLSANAITDILYPNEHSEGLEGKRVWVSNIIDSLSAIVYIEEETNVIRTCHPSVLDFIGGMLTGGFPSMSSVIKPFSIGLEQVHAFVYEGCFAVMDGQLRFNICDLENSFRLNKDVPGLPVRIAKHISEALCYGSLFWLSHLEQSGLKNIAERILAFLSSQKALFWVEVLSLLDAVDQGILILQDCARFLSGEPSAAGIAREWELFLLGYGDALKSTPHLYLSALSWLPRGSHLWNIVDSSFSPDLPMIANVPEVWNNERWSENVGTEVISVAYSADGRTFAIGCEDGSVRLWDARSGKKEREPFTTTSAALSVAFSPDNRWLASGHRDGLIRRWDLHANSDSLDSRAFLLGHISTGLARSIAFSSDGKRLVFCSSDQSIRVRGVELGTTIKAPVMGLGSYVTSVIFSSDDSRVVSGSMDTTIRVWDLETGEQIGETLQGHLGRVNSVACSRNGRFIASGSDDKTVRLWDAKTHIQIGDPLTGHTYYVNSVCFSFDSKYVGSASSDRSVRVWSVESHSLVCELRGHTGGVNTVIFSPVGWDLLSGSWDGTIRLWDTKRPVSSNQASTNTSAALLCVSYIPNSDLIISSQSDGKICLWDARTAAAIGKPIQGHKIAVNALAISSDGQWAVSGSSNNTLQMWDITSRRALGGPMLGHFERINSIAVSPDNELVASASNDNTVRLWDSATRELLMTLTGHIDSVTSVAFSVGGNYLITGSHDRTIRIWKTHTGEVVAQPPRGHSNRVTAVAVSPDGRWFASASEDWTARIWSTSTFSEIRVLEGHTMSVSCLAFSRNGEFLVTGSWDRTLRVWNVQTGEAVGAPLTSLASWIRSVAFAPNGHKFASGSADGAIRIWDIDARTDLELSREGEVIYSELGEEELRVRWNASRAQTINSEGWIRDGEKLLLWVPWQYRHDINGGTRFVIGAQKDTVRPEVDYRKLFRYSGMRWRDVYSTW